MKSLVMALNVLSVTIGNLFTAFINYMIGLIPSFKLMMQGANYYWFFTGIALVAACLFIRVALTFKEEAYLQDAEAEAPA
jgi:POT family proton-dependent oligopeptide transporter